jgi:predicted Ser/Thr protein kinase
VPDPKPGDVFAGHRITGVAGRGGMGVVYRAVQLDLDRAVALKLIAPDLAEDPAFRERFVRESRLAAAIDHPNVIPIYYTGEHEGALYIAMRYVDGSDLRTLVRAMQRLDAERGAHIVAQVGNALDAAHGRGIVHRDVKPANVLLGSGDHAYLTDFGLTKRIASHTGSTRTGGWVGTLGFAAPEQNRALDVLRRPVRTTDLALHALVLRDGAADPHERAMLAEELQALVRDMQRLPARQRTALVLHELGGASHEAIARHLDVSAGGSKALVWRARAGLHSARAAA